MLLRTIKEPQHTLIPKILLDCVGRVIWILHFLELHRILRRSRLLIVKNTVLIQEVLIGIRLRIEGVGTVEPVSSPISSIPCRDKTVALTLLGPQKLRGIPVAHSRKCLHVQSFQSSFEMLSQAYTITTSVSSCSIPPAQKG